ncbi:MAG: response regulator [Candidatus Polarisedimenticolia bacterium]
MSGIARRRLLLVDENDDFLDGLASWLAKQGGLEVAGRAHSGMEAVDRTARLLPDLILMNISLRDMSGFEAVRQIKARPAPPKILLMTFHESRAALIAALAAGADGCVFTSGVTEALLHAVETLLGLREQGLTAEERWDG